MSRNTITIKEGKDLKVAVHNSTFHTDEVVALALLGAFVTNEIEVERLPHQTPIEEFEPYDMVIDISSRYDGKKFFDHHQNSGGKSSAGLIWEYLLQEGLNPFYGKDTIDDFIHFVDYRDTRDGTNLPEGVLVDREYKDFEKWIFNPVSQCNQLKLDSTEQDESFKWLVEFFIEVFEEVVRDWGSYSALMPFALDENNNNLRDLYHKGRDMKSIKDNHYADIINNGTVVIGNVRFGLQFVPMEYIEEPIYIWRDSAKEQLSVHCDTDKYILVSGPNKVFIHANGFIGKFKYDKYLSLTFKTVDDVEEKVFWLESRVNRLLEESKTYTKENPKIVDVIYDDEQSYLEAFKFAYYKNGKETSLIVGDCGMNCTNSTAISLEHFNKFSFSKLSIDDQAILIKEFGIKMFDDAVEVNIVKPEGFTYTKGAESFVDLLKQYTYSFIWQCPDYHYYGTAVYGWSRGDDKIELLGGDGAYEAPAETFIIKINRGSLLKLQANIHSNDAQLVHNVLADMGITK